MSKDLVVDLPKLKNEIIIEIDDENLPEVYEISDKNDNIKIKLIIVVSLLLLIVIFSVFTLFRENEVFLKENKVNIKNVEVLAYNETEQTADVAIVPDTKQDRCSVTIADSSDDLIFHTLADGKCYVTVDLTDTKVYFSDFNNQISEPLILTDYVVDFKEKDKYYIALNSSLILGEEKLVVGNPNIVWTSDSDIVELNDNSLKGTKVGSTIVKAMVGENVVKEIKVVVTDTIVEMPKEFDSDKDFLGCEVFTSDEAALLDEILEYRIIEAGYGTRAAAVEAARFLTLEFPYRISYYWEAGRLNNTGTHYVDGEGRYYHKGLYLDESKFESIEASLFGPAMWGCKLMSYEDDPPNFVPGKKYPNGLDCSGFVTWALYNAGFDVGDRGAGELPTDGQLTDLGEFKKLSTSLINSGDIKVGDLFNFWGHISILIGEDEDNYYVAESLNNYKGVVVMKYSKKKIMNTFKYVVLMDDVYKEDGNLTDMWY